MERFLFAPIFQGVSLYTLARFDGKDHEEAVKNLKKLYVPVLVANWKYLSFFTLINFTVIPPMVMERFGSYPTIIHNSEYFSFEYSMPTLSDSAGSSSWPTSGDNLTRNPSLRRMQHYCTAYYLRDYSVDPGYFVDIQIYGIF